MSGIAVIGAQWGDEGKGKVIDLLSAHVDVVARYQGGPNAGHTVQVGVQKFFLHHIPSGILHGQTTCIVGNGVVILPEGFQEEVRTLAEADISVDGRLFVSSRAHIILPDHLEADARNEEGAVRIGTTKRGVGPCYQAKVGRTGLRVEDLLDSSRLEARLEAIGVGTDAAPLAETAASLKKFGDFLRPHVADTGDLLHRRLKEGARVLFEGAQGTLLDIDHGTYPFVTSSNSCAGGIAPGLGIGPTAVDGVVGVMKAYGTRVGEGPMPTELNDAVGERIRERGYEYGTTTGRPRRCGWFDGVLGRYAVQVNGLDCVALTLLDVLDEFETVRVATGYRLGDKLLDTIPLESWALAEVEPVYQEFTGWQQDTSAVRNFADLPQRAREFLAGLEKILGCPIGLVSVGPARDQYIIPEGSQLRTWFPQV
ncbi:MAG: adenylosuccinate synthase [Acidobacteria bacterium]|nr:MAG: adenylosuccinate synthase [Acidobacteriota bacterium]